MVQYQKEFIRTISNYADQADHPFPLMAACEAALESGYGTSKLAILDKNLFGMKQRQHPVYGTHVFPTREFEAPGKDIDGDGIKGEGWVTINSAFVSYPSYRECFIDRLNTLKRLSSVYPAYKAALESTSAVDFVTNVSKTWSTDPDRAKKVISIYNQYLGV